MVRFRVAKDDVGVLLGDLDAREPSVLYAKVVKQLGAAAAALNDANDAALEIDETYAEAFREWLARSTLRHTRNGDAEKARAFERVRASEH